MNRQTDLCAAIAVLAAFASVAYAQSAHYAEVDLSGVVQGTLYEMANGVGGGVAIADFDDDGDLDFFLPNKEGLPDRLIQNLGNGLFDDIANFCGVTGIPGSGAQNKPRSRNALFIDYDGDRRLDLFVAGDCFDCDTTGQTPTVPTVLAQPGRASWSKPRLHRQLSDGTFEDATVAAGLGGIDFLTDCESGGESCAVPDGLAFGPAFVLSHLGGLAAGDFNGDGLPDLFVGHWFGAMDSTIQRAKNARIFLSDAASGMLIDDGTLLPAASHSHWQAVVNDFNPDALTNQGVDLFAAVDVGVDKLWLSDLIPYTEQMNEANMQRDEFSTDMGVAIGDFNNDGSFDYYITTTNRLQSVAPGQDAFLMADPSYTRQAPYEPVVFIDRNRGANPLTLPFVDEGLSWGWGVTALDADLDGDEDLAITNGFSNVPAISKYGGTNNAWVFQNDDHSLLLINNLSTTGDFSDDSAAWGFDDTEWGSALGAFDFDRDGDLDLAQTIQRTWQDEDSKISQFRLLRNDFNDAGTHFWLTVKPRLTTRNTRSLGAVVRATYIVPNSGGQSITQSRLISAGESFMTQEPAEAHFGFGPIAPTSVTITIE